MLNKTNSFKTGLAFCLSFFLFLSVFSVCPISASATEVVPDGYIGIYNADDLNAVRNNLAGNYILMNDIDLSSVGNWLPIGGEYQEDGFSGVLDGNGHAILNMNVDADSVELDYVGLFSILNGATIKNIKAITGRIYSENTAFLSAGAVAGMAYGSNIAGCASYVEISYQWGEPTGEVFTTAFDVCFDGGGIAGCIYDNTIITECCNYGSIKGVSRSAPIAIGGIVGVAGFPNAEITDCFNSASLSLNTGFSSAEIGGIVGSSLDITISRCYNAGRLDCKAGELDYIGGIVGDVNNSPSNSIVDCYYNTTSDVAVGCVPILKDRDVEIYINVSAESLNTALMQERSSFVGFDFSSIWRMGDKEYPFPILRTIGDYLPNINADNSEDNLTNCDHTWGNSTVTKAATCKEPGVKTYTCTKCSNTKTESIAKLTTHSYKSEWSKDGTNHWHECSVCQNKKDLAAHTPGTAATETTAQTCATCGYVIQESVANTPCALDELTDLDFLAFSNLAYFEFPKAGTTVKEMLGSKWNTEWSNGIKYSELYNHIQNWTFDRGVENKSSGFCAHSYRNNQNELVLVYRGSEDLNNIANKTEDWWADWIATNLIMLLNNDSEQIDSAITFYNHIMRDYTPAKVAITGHSLGGALGDIVAAYSGCKGVTFNAAPFLDVAYSHYAKQMAVAFTGVDTWTFTDIINKEDVVGMVGNSIKPRRICPDNGLASSAHSLKSFVNKNQYGMLYLTAGVPYTVEKISWAMPDLKSIVDMPDDISDWLLEDDFKLGYYVDLGTSGDDEFYGALSAQTIYEVAYQLLGGSCKHYAYGGNGSDSICTGVLNDTIVGGKGTDFLSGSWGDDIYIYNKGDGIDYIIDPHGEDGLLLYGFDNDDVIHFESELDSDYIDVYCNLDVIIRIDKNCRDGWQLDNFSVRVNPDSSWDTYNIPARLFNPKKYTQRYVICCPVNIAFVDKDGNVAEVIQDGKTGIYSGEYGMAVVYLDESGDCCKAIDLAEGYTIQVLGHSDGKMDIAMWNVEDGVLSEYCYVIESVEVTETMRASITESNNGVVTLAVDTNGDGTVEDNHILSLVAGENTPSDESTQPTEGSTQPTEGTHLNIPDNKGVKDTSLDIWWIASAVVCVVAVGGVCVAFVIRKRNR